MKRTFPSLCVAFLLLCAIGSSAQTTLTYSYTGSVQTYTVPVGVTSIGVDVLGASGGSHYSSTGGCGGEVVCSLAVVPGQVLYLNVGGVGGDGSFSGSGSGGQSANASGVFAQSGGNGGYSPAAGEGAGGGGGSSDIRVGGATSGFIAVCAGGGGGGGFDVSGCGSEFGGTGGGPGTAGNGMYCSSYSATNCGAGASVGSGGLGSVGGGFTGGSLLGGDGICPSYFTFSSFLSTFILTYASAAGGGGGGGYYGGGGGSAGGGGGGSSYTSGLASSITSSSGTSCTGDGSIILHIPCVPPTAGTIVGPGNVCIGMSVTLSDPTGTAGGVWTSSSTGVATVGSSTGVVTGVTSGVVTITRTVTLACGTTTATKTVTVSPAPVTGTIATGLFVCLGGTSTLTDPTGDPGGVWSTVTPAVATVGSSSGIISGISVGTTVVSYTVTNICGTLAATAIATVNTAPSAGTITGTFSVCQGATTTLVDGAGSGGWSSLNPLIASVSGTGVVTGVNVGSTTITYTVTSSCGSAFTTATVTVNPIPNPGAIFTPTLTLCPGNTTTLSDFAPGGTWSSVSPGVATIGTSGIVTGVAGGTTIISYTSTTAFCGSAAATVTMTVNPAPNAGTIAGIDSTCPGMTILLTDAIGGGTWSSSLTGVATIGSSSGLVNAVTAGVTNISYAVTNICGTAHAVVPVTVMPIPTGGTITGATSVCVGATTALSETVPVGVWSEVNGLTSISPTGVVTGVATGVDTIKYTVTTYCGTAVGRRPITIITTPVVNGITGPSNVCTGTTITLSDLTASGTWSAASTLASVTSGGVVTGNAVGTVNISYTVSNTCGPTSAVKTINVITVPTAGIVSGDTLVCPDSLAPMTSTVPGGVWGVVTGNALIDVTGVMGGDHPGPDTVTYTVSNQCGSATVRYPVRVKPYAACDGTGIGNIYMNDAGLYVHPNPNTGTFTLLLASDNTEKVEVVITNVVGEKMSSFITTTNKAAEVTLHGAAGMYFISATTSTGQYTAKVVVSK